MAIGSFYTYFTDKKELFIELVRIHDDDLIDEILIESNGSILNIISEKDVTIEMITKVSRYHETFSDFNRLADAMKYLDSDIREMQISGEEKVVKRLVSLLESLGDQVRVPDIEAAARIIRLSFAALVRDISLFGSRIEKDVMIAEFAEMATRYLFYVKA